MAPRLLLRWLLLTAALLSAAGAEEHGLSARVNGAGISSERLRHYFEDEFLAAQNRNVQNIRSPATYKRLKREALERLIDEELLWQESQRRDRVASEEEARATVAQVRARSRAPGDFERALQAAGFTEATFLIHVKRQLSVQRLVGEIAAAEVAIEDGEVDAYYAAHPDQFRRGGATVALVDARPAIRRQLTAERTERAVRQSLAALRAGARIEIGAGL